MMAAPSTADIRIRNTEGAPTSRRTSTSSGACCALPPPLSARRTRGSMMYCLVSAAESRCSWLRAPRGARISAAGSAHGLRGALLRGSHAHLACLKIKGLHTRSHPRLLDMACASSTQGCMATPAAT